MLNLKKILLASFIFISSTSAFAMSDADITAFLKEVPLTYAGGECKKLDPNATPILCQCIGLKIVANIEKKQSLKNCNEPNLATCQQAAINDGLASVTPEEITKCKGG